MRFIPVSIILSSVLIRVLYWYQVHDEAWFIAPGMDPEFYLNWADAIISGHGSDYLPFPRAPLYPYILASIRYLFGESWIVPRILNLIAELVTIILIYRLTVRIDTKAAIFAAIFYALTGASLYYSGETLMTSLSVLLSIGFVYSLSISWKQQSVTAVILSGVLLGLLVLFRPNALIILPFSGAILAWISYRQTGRLSAIKQIATHWVSAVIILLPITIVNFQASGSLIPISTQGGVNFYIGNAQNATGWSSTLPEVGAQWSDNDARKVAELQAKKHLTSPQVSRELWIMGWQEIMAEPLGWGRLMLKKLILLLNAREIGNNRPLLLASDASWLIRILFFVSMGTLFPLALLGVVAYYRKPEVKASLLFVTLFGGSLLLFFVNSRYRLPLMPMVALLAGLGVVQITKVLSVKSIIIFSIGCLIAYPGWNTNDWSNRAQAAYVDGNAWMRLNNPEEALIRYLKAEKVNPRYPELQLNIGVALMTVGDYEMAREAFLKELEHSPSSGKALNNLGIISEYQGDLISALDYYLRADSDDGRYNAKRIQLQIR